MNAGARVLSEGTPAVRSGGDCPNCGAAASAGSTGGTSGLVYAVGRITPQFPDLGVEKEFAQLGGGAIGAGAGMIETDRLLAILRDPASAYLARQLCWVFSAGDVDAFVIAPRDDAQLRTIIESLPRASAVDQTIQVVVGVLGPPISGTACAAATLPTVLVDQHLSFPIGDFLDALADQAGGKKDKERGKADNNFAAAARDLFARLTKRSENRGTTDEHRAANYVALRYPQLYRLAADAHADDKTLIEVQLRRGQGGARRLVAVRLAFRARRTEMIDRYQCLVDVTDRFPFLASPLAPVYD